MNLYLDNIRRLFSDKNEEIYQALLEKKDWIFQSFYCIGSFDSNRDAEDIIEGKLRFRKLYLNPDEFSDHGNYLMTEEILRQFRFLYLYKNIPDCESGDEFIIRYDFRKLNDREYMMLFPNLYPCLKKDERACSEEDDLIASMKRAMDDSLGDAVLIMGEKDLTDSCFPCRAVGEIFIPSSLNVGYRAPLRLLCAKLNIPCKEIDYDK